MKLTIIFQKRTVMQLNIYVLEGGTLLYATSPSFRYMQPYFESRKSTVLRPIAFRQIRETRSSGLFVWFLYNSFFFVPFLFKGRTFLRHLTLEVAFLKKLLVMNLPKKLRIRAHPKSVGGWCKYSCQQQVTVYL